MSYDKRDIITPTTDVGAGYLTTGFGLCIIKMVRAYDAFSGNRRYWRVDSREKKNSLTTFRGSAKATFMIFLNG